jgi:outer membrane protein assembly factor BamA
MIASQLEGGPDALRLAVTLTQEALFGTRASLAFSVFHDVLRPKLAGTSGDLRLRTRSSGLGLGWSYPVAESQAFSVNYALAQQTTRYSLGGLTSVKISSRASSSSLGFGWNANDGQQRWDLGTSVSGGWLGGEKNLLRSSVEYSRLDADPLSGGRNTWAFRAHAAGVSSFHANLALEDRHFAGQELLRGFRSGEIAPYALESVTTASGTSAGWAASTGSNLVTAANAEYRVPVSARLQAVGFFDAGSGWLLPNWLGARRPTLLSGTNGLLRVSTGAELQWRAPVVEQPLRLGFAVNPLRLAESFLLPDGSVFRSPDRRTAWTWALGSLF